MVKNNEHIAPQQQYILYIKPGMSSAWAHCWWVVDRFVGGYLVPGMKYMSCCATIYLNWLFRATLAEVDVRRAATRLFGAATFRSRGVIVACCGVSFADGSKKSWVTDFVVSPKKNVLGHVFPVRPRR